MLAKLLVLVVLFAALASRTGYKLTSRVFGSWVANAGGCATGSGVALHALVFAVLAVVLMRAMWHGRRRHEGIAAYDQTAERCPGYKPDTGYVFVYNPATNMCDQIPEARDKLKRRKKARESRYNDAKARGDHLSMLRYRDDIGKQNKFWGNFSTAVENKRANVQSQCPANWTASGEDMCCERWWPDSRKQRCKTVRGNNKGKVWDRDWGHGWRAKKLGE